MGRAAVTLGNTQRLVLAFLADEGPIDSTEGSAVTFLADATGLGQSHAGNLVARLDELGFVERTTSTRRTFHLGITHEGRRIIGREAAWHRRQRRSRLIEEAPAPPAMPVVGAIGPLGRFSVETAREAAAKAAVV